MRDALSRVATEDFDLLLSDLHMPHAGAGFTDLQRHATHPPGGSDAGVSAAIRPLELLQLDWSKQRANFIRIPSQRFVRFETE